MTAQNHNYAVEASTLAGIAEMTHVNLNDGVIEGIRCTAAPRSECSTTPRPGPGPHDARYLFDSFAALMRENDAALLESVRKCGDGLLMPRRDDIESILVIGSGPIVIGQACEFDYSGTQACRVLGEEGYRVILANSNPATIMTDPERRRPHVHRASGSRGAGGDHRARAPRRGPADARRPDGTQPRDGTWPTRERSRSSG